MFKDVATFYFVAVWCRQGIKALSIFAPTNRNNERLFKCHNRVRAQF